MPARWLGWATECPLKQSPFHLTRCLMTPVSFPCLQRDGSEQDAKDNVAFLQGSGIPAAVWTVIKRCTLRLSC